MSDFDFSVGGINSRGSRFSDYENNGRSNWIDKGEKFGLRPEDFESYADYINAVKNAESQTSVAATSALKGDTVEFSSKKANSEEAKKEDAEAVKSEVNNIYQDVLVAQITPFANTNSNSEEAAAIESQIEDLTQNINTINSVATQNSSVISKENEIKDEIAAVAFSIEQYEEASQVQATSESNTGDTQDDILSDDTYLKNAMEIFGATEDIEVEEEARV